MSAPSTVVRFDRTQPDFTAEGSASEVLTICVLDAGELLYSETLGRESPYVVQITSGPEVGDDFVGLYDLDGEKLSGIRTWEVASDVPSDVIEAVETGWATGNNTVTRIQVSL